MAEPIMTLIVGGHSSTAHKLMEKLSARNHVIAAVTRRGEDVPGVFTAHADAIHPEEMEAAIAKVHAEFGRIDNYVHLVGSILLKPLHQLTVEQWRDTLELNLSSVFYGLKPALPFMMHRKQGHIVLVSSVAALIGIANHEAMAASKGGVASLVPALACSYLTSNIRVNGVAPALVNSQMAQPLVHSEISMKGTLEMTPLHRIAEPEDVANVISFLLSPEADFMTGVVLPVDGGLSTVRRPPKVSAA